MYRHASKLICLWYQALGDPSADPSFSQVSHALIALIHQIDIG